MEEHQKHCTDQLSLSPHEIKKKILQRQHEFMAVQRETVVSRLCRDDTVPVKNELGEDFCHNCATYEEHRRNNCLKMTRMEALEALLPKMRYDWLSIRYQLINVIFDQRKEEGEKEYALYKDGQPSQLMLGFIKLASPFLPDKSEENLAHLLKSSIELEAKQNRAFDLEVAEEKLEEFVRKMKADINAKDKRCMQIKEGILMLTNPLAGDNIDYK
ncbi:hypothetical protein L3Y34_013213 [Caenorhabditis briggsae]|uniref:Uncharacterized protein n=1 Tax=Caenorhabditis briggsae TaxID=6238 RepID=A0AAE8ZUC9_CAEBR|nr:hypothetical protein L3Y34_013213 [Caenorhabditis briggsae]